MINEVIISNRKKDKYRQLVLCDNIHTHTRTHPPNRHIDIVAHPKTIVMQQHTMLNDVKVCQLFMLLFRVHG